MKSTQTIKGLTDIINQYDVFILDQWGVMHDGIKGYIQAIKCVEKLYQEKKENFHLVKTELGIIEAGKNATDFSSNSKVYLSIRPESIKIKRSDRPLPINPKNRFTAKLLEMTYFGDMEQLKIQCLKTNTILNSSIFNLQTNELAIGATIECHVDSNDIIVLPDK